MTDTPMATVAWLCRLPKLGCFVTDNIAVASECLTQQGVVEPLVTEAAASATIKGLEAARDVLLKALDEIRELNATAEDENGNRWANSDLIDQTITFALIEVDAALKGSTHE